MISENMLKQHVHGYDMTEHDLYSAYKVFFGTLVSESRLKIVNLLRSGRKNVGEIMLKLDMDQTAVSHDLARLKRCGFVNVEVDGKFRYYKLNDLTIRPLISLIDKHMKEYCVHIVEDMKEKEHGR